MTDLLTLALADVSDAHPDQAGVMVPRPWGTMTTVPLPLKAGWYRLDVEGSSLCLQLYDAERFRLIELSAQPDAPAYVRLQAGTYTPKLFVGVRPGYYPLTLANLAPLGALQRIGLLSGRLIQALRSGVTLSRLLAQARLVFKPKATFGLRARAAEGPAGLGVLTRQDLHGPVETDIQAPPDGPVFLVIGGRPSNQTYGRYTLDPDKPHDFVVTIADGDRLTQDALRLMAEALVQCPETDVLIADKWVDGEPTTHVAFDPLLYADGYPTPHAIREGYIAAGSWRDQQARHAVLSVPVATGRPAPIRPQMVRPEPHLPVSIIIPTRDRADLLETCLAGLFDSTPWPHEVIIVDNGSVEPATHALFAHYAGKGLRIVRAYIPFNFSSLCNLGAAAARHDYLVFLNNDVVLHQPDWLARMMTFAVHPDAGAIGARLYYADKRLQHGGVMLGLTQLCGHLWRGLAFEAQQNEPRLVRNSLRAAVTAALLCIDRRKFDAVGGFDETVFPVTLNDVDLCLKLYKQGWYSIFAAEAEAYHLEGESRGDDEDETKARRRQAELSAFDAKWHDLIAADPWLPAAIMRSTEIFGFK